MPGCLTYNDLPIEISQWPALPLSLSGNEVMPLDYRAGTTGWLIYGRHFNKQQLSEFQSHLVIPLVVVAAWCIESYQVVRLAGIMPKRAKKIADEMLLDISPLGNIPQLHIPGMLILDIHNEANRMVLNQPLISKIINDGVSQSLANELGIATLPLELNSTSLSGPLAFALTAGLSTLCHQLRKERWKIVLIHHHENKEIEKIAELIGFDAVFNPKFNIKQQQLRGKMVDILIETNSKVQLIPLLSDLWAIPVTQSVVVGNDHTESRLMQSAALSIAYHAKTKMNTKAKTMIKHADLRGILCILSASDNYEER